MKIINQELTKFSTIRTKSHAEYFCQPQSISDLKKAIKFKKSKNLDIVILGNGSNILFSKDYYDNILFVKLSRKHWTHPKKLVLLIITSILSTMGFIAAVLSLLDLFGVIDMS